MHGLLDQGYYEDGMKNRFGDLHRWKTWVSIRITPKGTGSIIDCRIIPNPYIFLLFCIGLFSVLEAIITRHWDDLVGGLLGLVIMFVIVNDIFNVTDWIVKTIQSRLNDVICKEEQ